MKSIKHFLIALVLGFAGTAAHAQIPVTDVASLTQQMQQVASWAKQITAMKDQLESQKQLFDSLNGGRGIGQLLNNPQLRNALPSDWQGVYTSVQSGGYAGLTGSAKAIRDANMIYNCNQKQGTERALCDREASKAAQDKAFSMTAYDSAQKRLDNIQSLMGQIDGASDAKTAADLQNRMQAENAMIQNEQTKLMMFKMMADAEEKLIIQQKHETDMQNVGRKTRTQTSLTPLKF